MSSSVKEFCFLHICNCICTPYCCEVGRCVSPTWQVEKLKLALWSWEWKQCSLKLRGLHFFFFFFFFGLFVLLGPHSWHMEVPRLGAYTTATATPDLSRVCDLHHSSQQHWLLNPLSEARDRTRNLMVPSQELLLSLNFKCYLQT